MPTVLTIHENDYCVLSQLKLILLASAQSEPKCKITVKVLKSIFILPSVQKNEKVIKVITEN